MYIISFTYLLNVQIPLHLKVLSHNIMLLNLVHYKLILIAFPVICALSLFSYTFFSKFWNFWKLMVTNLNISGIFGIKRINNIVYLNQNFNTSYTKFTQYQQNILKLQLIFRMHSSAKYTVDCWRPGLDPKPQFLFEKEDLYGKPRIT